MIIIVLLSALLATTTHAFQLTPMSYTFSYSNTSHYFTISNDSNKYEAIQLTMAKRLMDIDGKEQHPEVNNFIIFPDQLILKPQERRKIKVQLITKNVPKIEQAYRLIAEQLPINLQRKSKRKIRTNINLLLRYIASIYVAPPKKEIKFKLVSTRYHQHKLHIVIHNTGNTHFLLKKLNVTVKDKNNTYTYPLKQLQGMYGENILAGHKRLFTLKFPRNINQHQFKVGIKFDHD